MNKGLGKRLPISPHGGKNAATMANRASTRTRQLYDRRHADVSMDEVDRIHM
ncbi:hypothetical protein PTKU15_94550 (plasmid) [Paraburkholderia terrae]|nr:hypothetical protein PTKU15_94550 [Paraburkholderia terrae]